MQARGWTQDATGEQDEEWTWDDGDAKDDEDEEVDEGLEWLNDLSAESEEALGRSNLAAFLGSALWADMKNAASKVRVLPAMRTAHDMLQQHHTDALQCDHGGHATLQYNHGGCATSHCCCGSRCVHVHPVRSQRRSDQTPARSEGIANERRWRRRRQRW